MKINFFAAIAFLGVVAADPIAEPEAEPVPPRARAARRMGGGGPGMGRPMGGGFPNFNKRGLFDDDGFGIPLGSRNQAFGMAMMRGRGFGRRGGRVPMRPW